MPHDAGFATMKHKAVIFDLFGTLVDAFSVQANEGVLAEMAAVLSAPSREIIRLWTRDTFSLRMTGALYTLEANLEHICRALGVPVQADQIAAAVEKRLVFTRRGLAPRADAVDTLTRLKAAGLKIGLISDCSSEVPRLWPDTPFARWVDVPIFSCDMGCKKPNPRIYALACERLGVRPQDCLYVGDGSSQELTGASRVGMTPVLIRVPYEATYDPYRPDADDWQGTTIRALKDVLALVVEKD